MLWLRLVLFCGVFLTNFLLAANDDDYKNIYLRAYRCIASEKFIFKNYSCYTKSYSRTYSTLNAYGVAKIPLYNITGYATLYYKYGIIYRQVLRSPTVNVCDFNKFLANIDNSPGVLVSAVVKMIEASVPGLIHECPYTSVDFKNATPIITTLPDIFPSGDYKAYAEAFSGGEKFVQGTIFASVISSNKDTFG